MKESNQTYTITELATEFSVTPRAIRHYEDEALIQPQREGAQRIYTRGDRIRLQLILRGKRVGFSLKEIREIISMYDSPSGEVKQTALLLQKIEDRRQTLAEQQRDIQTMLGELEHLENKIKG